MSVADRSTLPNRWLILFAASVVMLTTGTIYAWGLFTEPLLVAYHWDLTVTTSTYAVANFCLGALGALIGGFWQDRVGPRRVAMLGVTLWGAGNLLAGLGTPTLGAPWLLLTYGVIGGTGAGMAYITPLSMVTRWFPDRKGLAGGLVAGAFGLGAFVYSQLVPRLPGFHAAVVHAEWFIHARASVQAGSDITAVMHVFMGSGAAFLIVGLLAASRFRNPPGNYRIATHPPHGGWRLPLAPAPAGYSPSQVMGLPQFYSLWLQLFFDAIAGIAIISDAVYLLSDLTHHSTVVLAPLFGLISIFNAIGRLVWGALSDRIGCNHTFAAMFAVQSLMLLVLFSAHGLVPSLAAVAVILLCCGGGFGTMPAYNAEYFGTRCIGLNYGLLLTAWGFAGLIGPILVAHVKDLTGSFTGLLPVFAAILLVAVILPFITRKPQPATDLLPIGDLQARYAQAIESESSVIF